MSIYLDLKRANTIAEWLRGNNEFNLKASQVSLAVLQRVNEILEAHQSWDRDLIWVVESAIDSQKNK